MRGTCAVIGIVLLLVLVAHIHREEATSADDGSTPLAVDASAGGGCHPAGDAAVDDELPPTPACTVAANVQP